MLSIGLWCSIPRSGVKVALGSVTIVYCSYIIPTALAPYFRPNPNFHPPHTPPLPLHYLRFTCLPLLPPSGLINPAPPVPIIASGPVSPASTPPPDKGPEQVTLKCTAWHYSGVWICKYPSYPIPPPAGNFLVGGKSMSCLSVSEVAYPPTFSSPCGGRSPGAVQPAGLPPTSLLQITGLPETLTARSDLAFCGPLPPSPKSWKGNTSSSATYVG